MKPEDAAPEVVPAFDYYWKQTLAKCQRIPTKAATYSREPNRVEVSIEGGPKQMASILPALCKAFGGTFVLGSVLKLIQDLLTFASPQLLR